MKKIIALALSAVLALSMVACGGSDTTSNVSEIADTIKNSTINDCTGTIDEYYMAFLGFGEIDYATDEYTLSDEFKSFAGYYSERMPGVDIILAVEAADGRVEDVKAKLQQRIDQTAATYENYASDGYYNKVTAARLVVKGNVVVLAIAGDMDILSEQGIEAVYEPVDAAIEEAFK